MFQTTNSGPEPKTEQEIRDEKLQQITPTPDQAEGERDPGPDAVDDPISEVTRTPGQAEGEDPDQLQIEQEQRDSHLEDTSLSMLDRDLNHSVIPAVNRDLCAGRARKVFAA